MGDSRIGKISESELNEIAEESYRQITNKTTTHVWMPKDMTDSECIKEGLSALTDYFNAALQGDENKSALKRMWNQQIGVLEAILSHSQHQERVEYK